VYWQLGGDRDLSNLCLGLYVSCLLPRSAVGLKFVSYGLENRKKDYRKTELIGSREEFKYLALGGRFIISLRSSTTSRNSAVLASRFLCRFSGFFAVLSALVRLLRFLLFSD
jgi:hypothetical protein